MFEWSIVWLTSQNGNLTGQLSVKSKSPSPRSSWTGKVQEMAEGVREETGKHPWMSNGTLASDGIATL